MAPPLAWYPTWMLGGFYVTWGVETDLSDKVTSQMSPKPHLECFTNSYHIYKKYFCTLISCEWVYGTTLSLIRNLNVGWFLCNLGGRDRPIRCGYIIDEPQTPLGVLHKFISYIYEIFFHLDMLWIGKWHQPEPDSPLSLRLIFRNVGVGTDLSDVVTSWLSPKPTWSAS